MVVFIMIQNTATVFKALLPLVPASRTDMIASFNILEDDARHVGVGLEAFRRSARDMARIRNFSRK
jgi:hypothetical protein